MSKFTDEYLNFLSVCKTERRCVSYMIEKAKKSGYKNLEEVKTVKAGDKLYYSKMNKALILFNVGKKDLREGMNILGSHIDSPRLDLKPNPLYESSGCAYFNTHYYGGIKKYQWTALPLSLYGVVCLKNGKSVDITIGDNDNDPVFCISDILPHLADSQMKKNAKEFIDPEKLDILVGSMFGEDYSGKKKADNVLKSRILKILKDKYGIEEDDFLSSEIEVVPQGKARYLGFDKSMVLGYGQDDRVCAFSSFKSILDLKNTDKTCCVLLSDKEEIGSYGATGMNSHLLDNAVSELVEKMNIKDCKEFVLRKCLSQSKMLSSDVNAAFDPLNPELFDKENSSFMGKGLVFNKYTGSRGKSGASDANPEFIAEIRSALDKDKVKFQFAELGKVEVGGGGTIALYAAEFGMNVIDAGVAVLSMHAPWEITSVFDIEEAYKGYCSFLKNI